MNLPVLLFDPEPVAAGVLAMQLRRVPTLDRARRVFRELGVETNP
jgi:hypothetical protein